MNPRVAGVGFGVLVGVIAAALWWQTPHRTGVRIAPLAPLRITPMPNPPLPPAPPAPAPPAPAAAPAVPGDPTGVRGRLVDLHGKPLAGVVVRAGERKVLTDAAGRFTLELPPGGHRFEVDRRAIYHQVDVPSAGFVDITLVAADRRPLRITPV